MNTQDIDESTQSKSESEEAVEEDGTPVLDEKDLEENGLSLEEADQIEWEEPKEGKGSSGPEEKDVTA
ncbi:MAG: hypothetical protein JWQ96_2992 [Segetibacter sp.]|nr:hypothetical protein [Segetibacter sp.]